MTVPKCRKELLSARFDAEFHQKVKYTPVTFKVWKPHPNFKKGNPGLPDFQVLIYNKNDDLQHFPTYMELRSIFASLDYKFEFLNEVEDDLNWDANTYVEGIPRSEYNHKTSTRSSNQKRAQSLKSLTESSPEKKNVQPSAKKKSRTYPPHIQQTRRLKAGYRSFILAIMDNGLITFVKMSEADFGSENVWYSANTQSKLDRKWRKHKKNFS